MKALLLATYLAAGGHSQPVNISQEVDASDCRSSMMQVMDQFGLKNHVYSSGVSVMRAQDKNGSVSATCKPFSK